MKNAARHTPGPFVPIATNEGTFIFKVLDWNREKIAEVFLRGAETECNARLFAAAPELLEIAKAYRNLLRTAAHTDGEVASFHHIDQLIAKVEGRK